MKKILLPTPSKLSRFYFRTLSVLFLIIGVTTSSHSQCNFYQHYNSGTVPAGYISTFATSSAIPHGATGSTTAAPRTGLNALTSQSAGVPGNYIETPLIATPNVFSFYIRRSNGGTTADAIYDVQVNDGVHGWEPLRIAANAANYGIVTAFPATFTTRYQQVIISCNGTPAAGYSNNNLRFRILDNRGPGYPAQMWVDDISWTSDISTDNTILIPLPDVSTCTPASIAPTDPTYTVFDVGGEYDFYNYALDNTLTFTPTTGNKLEITFITFNTNSDPLDRISVSGGTPTLTNYSGTGNPATVLYSGAVDAAMTVRFESDPVATTLNPGFRITVKCVPGTSCSLPGALNAATTITATSALATWTAAPGPPAGYDIYIDTNAAAVPGTPTYTSVAPSRSLTGLTPSTTYYYWVRSNCGGTQSAWVGPSAAFTTICAGIAPPYTENFNGQPTSAIPTCTFSDSPGWQVNTVNGYLTNNIVGTNFFTRAVTLAAGTQYRVSYDYGSALGDLDLTVYRSTNAIGTAPTAGSPWTLLASNVNVTGLNNEIAIFTSAFAGTYYIRFQLTRTSAPGTTILILDNINLAVETCGPARILTSSAVTASAATINWVTPAPPFSPPANGYQYFLSTSNTTPPYSATPTGITGAGTTSVNLVGLSSSTTYYIWVRSNCSGYFSAWSVPTSFTTQVGATPLVLDATTNGTTKTACDYSFFDSGGGAGDYSPNNADYTVTLVPGSPGTKVKVVFSSFATENLYDGLSIYNGNSIAAPLIGSGLPVGNNAATAPAGSFYGTTSPGTIISSAADGSLTFRFRTDVSILQAGWSAFVSCVIAPSITSFTPANNNCGAAGTVVITGTNFTSVPVTGVSFNGVSALYVVDSNTQITATIPLGANSGPISVSNATATGFSLTSFTVLQPPPVTTGVTICEGGSGSLTTATVCNGFVNSGTSISGTLNAGTDLTAPRPAPPGGNSTACAFAGGSVRNYQAVQFQVSISGNYVFQMASPFDAMGYITTGPFTPGSCATGTYIVGDDDSNGALQPRLTIVLTAGTTYTLYTTSWGIGNGTLSGAYNWTVTPPSGGQIMLQGSPAMNWYTVASGGSPIGTGASFNPVGVAGSGLANTNTAASVTYYAACSSNSTCRTPTVFLINARPVVTFTAQPGATACTLSDVTYTTQPGQTNYIWTVPGVLGTDYTITSGGIGTTSNTVTLQWLTTGTKTVTVNYTNAATCTAATATSSTATTVTPSGFTVSVTPNTTTICANVAQVFTASSATANFFTWTTTSGALFTDPACVVPYVALSNFATVYFKGSAGATVSVTGTVGGTGCSVTANAVVTLSTAIWTGVWSNGTGPTNTISAEFQANFTSSVNASATSGNLSACSVVVTSGTVLYDRGSLTVQNNVVVTGGSLTFDDLLYDVALYQVNNVSNAAGVYSGGNSGNITFTRSSAPLFRFDYTYWSAPVYPQNLLAMCPTAGYFLEYNNAWIYNTTAGSTTMLPAKGYAARAPQSYNVSPGMATVYRAPFIGIPNNGDISIPILGGANQMNLLGNPYPSSLNATQFINSNTNLNGTLYFWTHNTQSTAPYTYNPSDYSIFNLVGGTAAAGTTGVGNSTTPSGFIASGQGFFVKGLLNGSAVFNNGMRQAGSNNQFYRTESISETTDTTLEKHRYWLDMTSSELPIFKQLLVGYIETATNGIDRLFDGETVEAGNSLSLYTIADETKLSIQGRALPFDVNDTLPLGYKSSIAGSLTISLSDFDGLFTEQHVYLEDRVLNVIYDLTEGNYTFATEVGTFEDRFLLRYTTTTLGTPVFNENTVVVYKNENGLFVNSGNEVMNTVTVFDIRGRILATQKQVGATTTVFTTLPTTQQVLLVRIEGENGGVVTKKVVY